MVTLTTAENALKTVYLGAVSNQLNVEANPLLSKIKQSSADVWGREIRKMAPFGINGGIGAGTEDGALPTPAGNNYVQFVATLKNLYGTIEISDKAIRASQNNAGAFVDLLNAEMEGLVKASAFNLGRMLYGDGSGYLTELVSHATSDMFFVVKDTRNLIEGMVVQIYDSVDNNYPGNYTGRITYIDRANKKVFVDKKYTTEVTSDTDGMYFVIQGSRNNEITGLKSIFSKTGTLYGLDRANYPWLTAYTEENVGDIDEIKIQKAIDAIEENTGSSIDFITCSAGVKRAFQEYMTTFKRNIDVLDLAGGYKAMSYNGIPLVSDRFVPEGEMYLLNSKDFTLHQLCDWQWLEAEDGRIIRQKQGYPSFTATLVKYADLICDHPAGQAKLSGITTK